MTEDPKKPGEENEEEVVEDLDVDEEADKVLGGTVDSDPDDDPLIP